MNEEKKYTREEWEQMDEKKHTQEEWEQIKRKEDRGFFKWYCWIILIIPSVIIFVFMFLLG